MNRLQLVRRLILESGASNVTLGSTVGASGEAANFVNWIDDAWLEVQTAFNWPSLWEQASVTVPAGDSSAAAGLPHWRYVKDSAFIGASPIVWMPWDDFRLAYPTVNAGTPSAWSIRPDRRLALNATVSADTVVSVQRHRMPGRMAADLDEPALPAEFRMMLVWRGLMLYAGWDESAVAYRRAKNEYSVLKQLAFAEFPEMESGEPLL